MCIYKIQYDFSVHGKMRKKNRINKKCQTNILRMKKKKSKRARPRKRQHAEDIGLYFGTAPKICTVSLSHWPVSTAFRKRHRFALQMWNWIKRNDVAGIQSRHWGINYFIVWFFSSSVSLPRSRIVSIDFTFSMNRITSHTSHKNAINAVKPYIQLLDNRVRERERGTGNERKNIYKIACEPMAIFAIFDFY